MSGKKNFEFQGQSYFDDRLFVLYLCPGKVEIEDGDDGAVKKMLFLTLNRLNRKLH